MREAEKKRFAEICLKEKDAPAYSAGKGIGTYGEKRLHRVIKQWVCPREECHEQAVGRFVADLLMEGEIVEIQTGSLRPLARKLGEYLKATEDRITVIYPLIAERRILRMDPATGELLSCRRSPKKEEWVDALSEIFWLRELLPSERISLRLLRIKGEERRYSERVRHRKSGAYEGEFFPEELLEERWLTSMEDYRIFLPPQRESFTAGEYGSFSKQKGRRCYSCLNLLRDMGLLRRERDGRQYRYWVSNEKTGD